MTTPSEPMRTRLGAQGMPRFRVWVGLRKGREKQPPGKAMRERRLDVLVSRGLRGRPFPEKRPLSRWPRCGPYWFGKPDHKCGTVRE